jgi:hypothetical protein
MRRLCKENRSLADVKAMAASLVALHVAPDAKGLAAASVRALEGLLASVRMAVDAQAAGPAEGLITGLANVSVLGGREGDPVGRVEVVVMLPDVAAGGCYAQRARRRRREGLGQRTLIVKTRHLRRRRRRR